MALAAAWQPAIDDAALAALHARALELGVRDGAARALALREQVLDELALLLARADGERAARAGARRSPRRWSARTREHELARLKASLAAFDADRVGPSLHPLAAWERWLGAARGVGARRAARRTRGARDAVADGRARSPVGLLLRASRTSTDRAPRGPCYVMFDWLADRAEYVGDLVAVLANRENARIALASLRRSRGDVRAAPLGAIAPSTPSVF